MNASRITVKSEKIFEMKGGKFVRKQACRNCKSKNEVEQFCTCNSLAKVCTKKIFIPFSLSVRL